MKNPVSAVNQCVANVCNYVPEAVTGLALRLGIFFVFWPSVQTKLAGGSILRQKLQFWNLSDSTFLLFSFEYQIPLLSAKLAAYLATFGEFFLSLGILFGFLTRVSAFGLLLITATIQVIVYPEAWKLHLTWAVILLALMKYGPGKLSLDSLLK